MNRNDLNAKNSNDENLKALFPLPSFNCSLSNLNNEKYHKWWYSAHNEDVLEPPAASCISWLDLIQVLNLQVVDGVFHYHHKDRSSWKVKFMRKLVGSFAITIVALCWGDDSLNEML